MDTSTLEGIFYFYIENKVTDVGLRLSIAQDVPDELDVRVDNIADNKVVVYLKGNTESVKKFYNRLKTKQLGKAEKYTFSDLKPVESVGCFNINTDRFYHKLQCEQLGKFVEVGIKMGEDIHKMTNRMEELTKKMDTLPKNMAKELKAVLNRE